MVEQTNSNSSNLKFVGDGMSFDDFKKLYKNGVGIATVEKDGKTFRFVKQANADGSEGPTVAYVSRRWVKGQPSQVVTAIVPTQVPDLETGELVDGFCLRRILCPMGESKSTDFDTEV